MDDKDSGQKVIGESADGITATDGLIVIAGRDAVAGVAMLIALRMWNQTAKAKVNKVGLFHRGCSSVRRFNDLYDVKANGQPVAVKSWADVLSVTSDAIKTMTGR